MKNELKIMLEELNAESEIKEVIDFMNEKLTEKKTSTKITKELFLEKLELTEDQLKEIKEFMLDISCCVCIGGFYMDLYVDNEEYSFDECFEDIYDNFCESFEPRKVYYEMELEEIKEVLIDSEFLKELRSNGTKVRAKISENYDT